MAKPKWSEKVDQNRYSCLLCPRRCLLKKDQWGYCQVRQATEEGIVLRAYGLTTGLAVDPIEKKPLYHFLPGTRTLSFGTIGCNLGCSFCQNHHISRAKHDELENLHDTSIEKIITTAKKTGCDSVAFTYNEPIIFAEFMIETAKAVHKAGLKTVAVTAGYVTSNAIAEVFHDIDAVNVDLKAFNDDFYKRFCAAKIEPVLETLRFLVHKTKTWVEITNLLIPGCNDSMAEIDKMTKWIVKELSPSIPLHFSAFHPDFRLTRVAPTSEDTIFRAIELAKSNGLENVHAGNIRVA